METELTEKLIAMGKNLGFEGKELQEWVKVERDRAREDRAAERERRKEEAEATERLRRLELEAAKEDFERKMMQLEKEKELLLLKAENSNRGGTENPHMDSIKFHGLSPHKLLPPFDDRKDDLDAYLVRFEKVAEGQKWARDQWASALSICLTGEALAVYGRMSPADCVDYDKIKQALLHRFRLTEDGFREKFRDATPKDGETVSQYIARLENYWERWMELSGTKKDYNEVKRLLLKEQLLAHSEEKLTLYIRERKGEDLKELVTRAEQYVEAHNLRNFGKKSRGGKEEGRNNVERRNEPSHKRGDLSERDRPRCYICNRIGHRPQDCRSAAARPPPPPKCKRCGRMGHSAWNCRARADEEAKSADKGLSQESVSLCIQKGFVELKGGTKIPVVQTAVSGSKGPYGVNKLPVSEGKIGERTIQVLRDTGCNTVIVRKDLVSSEELTGAVHPVFLIDQTVKILPEADIFVRTPYFTGRIRARCMDNPMYDLVLGNVEGVRSAENPDPDWDTVVTKPVAKIETTPRATPISAELSHSNDDERTDLKAHANDSQCSIEENGSFETHAVVTRKQARERDTVFRRLKVPELAEGFSPEDFVRDQREDATLQKCFAEVGVMKKGRKKGSGSACYVLVDEKLYRKCTSKEGGEEILQLVVPKKHRHVVLELAHSGMMAGHLGSGKTADRILSEFYWPGLQADTRRFVASCDICQRTTPRGKTARAPLQKMPVIDTPFKRVAIDIIGPLQPPSARGNKFILTLMDYATRFPEAVALPSIETERVAEALVNIFSRVGIPEEVLSDRGTNFTSGLMKEVARLLSIRQLTTTPYHPMTNGLVEKFNGTLKTMLKRMCAERPRDWDRYLSPLLFAYREVPQESLGFSPFELLYGRNVRGPLAILRELWVEKEIEPELKSTYQYVFDLRNRLEDTCKIAHEELERASERYSRYFNARSQNRQLKQGDKVLRLLPTEANKLTMQWKGPFPIAEKRGAVDYLVDLGHRKKLFHINLLKKYEERRTAPESTSTPVAMTVLELDESSGDVDIPEFNCKPKETHQDIQVAQTLSQEQKRSLHDVIHRYEKVFSDVPGKTTEIECHLQLNTNRPINVKQYPLPFAVRHTIEDEVKEMLRLGIIEKSKSPYNSPTIIVKKPDGSNRLCIDFRQLNRHLVADAEPIPRADSLLSEVGRQTYFSKMDMTKGYWQVPLSEESKEFTAFSTANGHYHFKNMPFGIKTAPAVFAKLMRHILQDIPNVYHYYDDLLIATTTWEEHVAILQTVLHRIEKAGLTIRPTKCEIGFRQLPFLGHNIGIGILTPQHSILQRIQDAPRPKTKKQVRSFLGLAGYYRDFMANYAAVAAPLTDLTKKRAANVVVWTETHQTAFDALKRALSEPPILRAPDFSKPFVLRTDASDVGLGAVLLQEGETGLHPIEYASRKLCPREQAYSAIEKECLAIVWAIKRFHVFLYGTHFVLQTDHQPLRYLNEAKFINMRVLRWALTLQEYDFRVEHIRGQENVGADYMSRLD
ncbi:uncharacterized protein LOC135374051 [Ornithodoros turicata]|uniref:uncharacterized protein LOC135374051 n=1 Tax=Ornithodoros turicata TaxID=34597 RepID=UPI0031392AA2